MTPCILHLMCPWCPDQIQFILLSNINVGWILNWFSQDWSYSEDKSWNGTVHHSDFTIMNFNVLNFYIQIVKIEFVEFIKLLPAIINLWYEERWKFKLKLIIIKICFEIAADGYSVCCGGRPPGSKLSEVKTLDIE